MHRWARNEKRLQGTRKIIKPFSPNEPEKTQIEIRGAEDSRQLGWTLQIAVYDRVGGAVSKSQNGKRRMCRRILRNRGCTQDKQVRDLPMLQVRVDYRTVGRTAHDGASLNVSELVTAGVVVLQARKRTDFLRPHRSGKLDRLGSHKLRHLPFVLPPVDREPQQRVTETVFVRRVEIHVVAFIGEMLPGKTDKASSVVIPDGCFLPLRSQPAFTLGGSMPKFAMGR